MEWPWLYSVAADIPARPSPKTVRTYYDFFKSLSTIITDEKERAAYKKIIAKGPFKLTSSTLAAGPESSLQWAIDVHNGVLISLGGKPTANFASVWGKLKYARSSRGNGNDDDDDDEERLHYARVTTSAHLNSVTRSGKLVVVLFDRPHFVLLIPRPDTRARLNLSQWKARFDIDTAVVPGNISYRWYFTWPFSSQRVTKFPWYRVYKSGKMIMETADPDDVRRYLKQRAMRNAPVSWVSQNSARKKTPPRGPGVGVTFAHSLARGVGHGLGNAAGRAVVPPRGIVGSLLFGRR